MTTLNKEQKDAIHSNIKLLLATMYRDASNARNEIATIIEEGEESEACGSLSAMQDELGCIYEYVFPRGSLESDWLTILNKE